MSEPENEDGSDSSGVAERGKLAGFWLEAEALNLGRHAFANAAL